MKDLDKVLSFLKKNKSRDPLGYANKLFHIDVAWDDLKKAIIKLYFCLKLLESAKMWIKYFSIYSSLILLSIGSRWKLKQEYDGLYTHAELQKE